MPDHMPVPNLFTIQPTIEIVGKLDDGRRVYRKLTKLEFEEWQEAGGDWEDLMEDEDA